ncbi:MAG: hypothetical protein E6J69_05820 [Deltaproteobacteria bacterium]|nr:MAG: hypothetical protein E6J69_05820 [Deltaproteobacteria bacterium]
MHPRGPVCDRRLLGTDRVAVRYRPVVIDRRRGLVDARHRRRERPRLRGHRRLREQRVERPLRNDHRARRELLRRVGRRLVPRPAAGHLPAGPNHAGQPGVGLPGASQRRAPGPRLRLVAQRHHRRGRGARARRGREQGRDLLRRGGRPGPGRLTGGLAWDAPDAASSLSPVGIVNGLVFAGENLGAFKARDVSNGLPLFTFNAGGPIASGPVIADGMVFVGVGVLPGSGETEGLYAFAP